MYDAVNVGHKAIIIVDVDRILAVKLRDKCKRKRHIFLFFRHFWLTNSHRAYMGEKCRSL